MRRKCLLALFSLSLVWGAAIAAASASAVEGSRPHRLSLDGAWYARNGLVDAQGLTQAGQLAHGWLKVDLPANALDVGLADVAVHSFAKVFDWPRTFDNSLIYLCFDGVDYQATVWLNGKEVGRHEGYFEAFEFAVAADRLKAKDNLLVVRVEAKPEIDTLNKRFIKGVLSHHDTRPGGAWSKRGIERTTGGIWDSVYLRVSEKVAILDWQIDYELDVVSSRAKPSVQLKLRQKGSRARAYDIAVQVMAVGTNRGGAALPVFRKSIRLKPGLNTTTVMLPEAEVALWWPHELGSPNLYRATLQVFQGDRLLDQRHRRIGFRKIVCDPDTKIWRVNGKRFFLRGTNYIGTIWLARMTDAMARRDVVLMKQTHINVVRVHAHVTAPEFYRACDEEGVLIWQDFPLQWGYRDSEAFTREALRQAHAMVRQLGNHPSILAWCPHNEPPWDAGWMVHKYPNYKEDQNKTLDRLLGEALTKADPDRYMHPHSATEEHPWFGWYSGTWRDYGKPAGKKMISEFGAQALPREATLRQFIPAWAIFPTGERAWDLWEYHNFQRRESFRIAGIDQGDCLEAFIENSQAYQARLIKKAVESYRLQRFEPVTAIFQFMFVEHWPSINWGILDYLRLPKQGWFALKQAYQPVLPMVVNPSEPLKSEVNPSELEVWVVNDLPQAHPGATVNLSLELSRTERWQKTWSVNVLADEKVKAGALDLPLLEEGPYTLWLEVRSRAGRVLGLNQWDFQAGDGGGS